MVTNKAKAMAENHVNVDGNSYEDDIEEENEEDLTLFYFESLFRRDVNERATFLDNFSKSVKKWTARPADDVASHRLLLAHLPTALRLSINSPFEDIRDATKSLLKDLEVTTYTNAFICGGIASSCLLRIWESVHQSTLLSFWKLLSPFLCRVLICSLAPSLMAPSNGSKIPDK